MCPQLALVFSLLVAIGISGCGSAKGPTSPSALQTAVVPPPPVVPSVPQPTYRISGVIAEVTAAGKVPAEGVQLYCDSCGSPDGHTFASSDANGFYSFSWARNGVHPLFVWKDGYVVIHPSGTLSDGTAVMNVTVNGDTRFDIEIVRR